MSKFHRKTKDFYICAKLSEEEPTKNQISIQKLHALRSIEDFKRGYRNSHELDNLSQQKSRLKVLIVLLIIYFCKHYNDFNILLIDI